MFGRSIELYDEIVKQLNAIGVKMENDLQKEFIKYYKENYELIGKQNQFFPVKLDNDLVRQAVNAVWVQDKKTWNQRIWVNMENLQNSLQKILTDAIATGSSVDKITEVVMQDMNVGYYQANRLVRTELSHIRVISTLDSYRDAGVTQYEYIANGPNMCEECEELNGQIFSIDDIEHLPPVHPNCVCSILAVLDNKER